MKFIIGGYQETLVRTKSGFTAESLLKVLQLLRDRSPDEQIQIGAALLISLIAKAMNPSFKAVNPNQLTVNAKWLKELAEISRNKNGCTKFITAFVNEILPPTKNEETTQ